MFSKSKKTFQRSNKQLMFIFSVLISSTALSSDLPMGPPESVGVSSDRLDRLSESMQRYIDSNQLAGTVSVISRKGKVVHFESQGFKSKENREAMSDDTIFFIMSMTKPIVSTALMMLYEEGHFLLTDPITDWIPELKSKQVVIENEFGISREPTRQPINFRHVLSHTAGLDPSREVLTDSEVALLSRTDNLEDTIIKRAPLPLAFHPGEEWQYGSSTDYVALLVERISGEPLKDYLRKNIFSPLGMEDTFYSVPEDKRDRVASVYSPSGPGQTIELFRGKEYSARPFFGENYYGGTAGLFSTASDYWRFSQMLLNGGELSGVRLLSPKTVSLMISNHSGDGDVYIRGPGYTFGLGFGIVSDAGKARDPLTPGTFSWGGAWGTIFWVDPVEEMIGIMMTQITSYRHLTVRQELGVTAMQSIIDSNLNLIGYPVLK